MADIELVIRIPEEKYDEITSLKWLCSGRENGKHLLFLLVNAVQDGITLPKGHGRLIEDTPELERDLWTYTQYTGIDEAPYESAVKVIDEAPTIIAACTLADADSETWNGYHGQVTAPNGTFKRIYADADGGDVV